MRQGEATAPRAAEETGAGPGSAEEALAEALQGLAQGRTQCLDRIWDLCARDLYALALWRTGRVVEAEDAVQEVFLRLARAPEAPAAARRPKAYLLTMAHRAAIDQVRKRGRTSRLEWPDEGAGPTPPALVAPPQDPGRAADAEHAARLIAALPPEQREVVYLKHFAELTFEAVGRVTGVPTFTAASRYRLALRRLRRRLGVE
jgi:RNA polymerase sigma-70 factor, ECF subfamily